MKFLKIILGSVVLSVIIVAIYFGFFNSSQDILIQKDIVQNDIFQNDIIQNYIVQNGIQNSTNTELIKWHSGDLFDVFVDPKDVVTINGQQTLLRATLKLKPELSDTYSEIGVYDQIKKPLIIIPIYTISAYLENGFYDFYNGKWNTCTTTKIQSTDRVGEQFSANAIKSLELLGYDSITDVELDKNPDILSKYDKIVVLHSEYVTQKEFDAITSHPHVIYLYPNALYAKIDANYINNTITLIRGHGYPDEKIGNGFNWKYDTTHPYEYDKECKNWEFYDIPNGKMLNCYPEQKVWKDKEFLKILKEL